MVPGNGFSPWEQKFMSSSLHVFLPVLLVYICLYLVRLVIFSLECFFFAWLAC